MEEKPNTSIIEMYSINKLTDAVLRTGVIEPDIHENDKTPSWDGEMRLYHSSEFNKSNFICLVFCEPAESNMRLRSNGKSEV